MPEGSGVWLIAAVWLLACALDRTFGEARRFHPLVGFGRLSGWVEKAVNRRRPSVWQIVAGMLCWSLLVVPPVVVIMAASGQLEAVFWPAYLLLDVVVLYWAIAWRSMADHVRPIAAALQLGDVPLAAQRLSFIVSRNTQQCDEGEILAAALESTLENSNDALFGSLFWYAILGSGGVILHRLSNTLDAMWGYRNERFNDFGRWAARSDDVLNFVPGQLTALSFALVSGNRRSWQCWWGQGWRWKSINAGSVMATGAAALGVILGGAARYDGSVQHRAALGSGRLPVVADVERAFGLVRRSLLLWFAVLLVIQVGSL